MKKDLHITLDIEKLPEGYYLATSRDVQGLVAQAKTFEKTVEIAEDIARKLLQAQKWDVRPQERIVYPMVISA
jgi:predicted RNase H-like HicB family nuclease